MNARCINTGKVIIGRAYVPPPQRVQGDALKVQAAFLEQRTRHPVSRLRRLVAPVWRWL